MPIRFRQDLCFLQIVRAEEDGRVVRPPHFRMKSVHLELGPRVEPGRRLIEKQQYR